MHIGGLLIIFSFALSAALFTLIISSFIFKKNYYAIIKIIFYTSGVLIASAVVLLFSAFIGNRFDLTYVYNYSSSNLQIYYKIAGFWAGQEGSFLLWSFFLFIFGALVIRKKDDYWDIVLSFIVLTQIFILLILSRQSPFEYIWQTHNVAVNEIPADGSGLNPLLQDPWMILHPPVLFLGYASACVPYGYAIAALIRKEYSGWIYKADKWILFCLISLGTGIFLGAYWAYKVLGWGGYWGWDPVENSSLIPWLVMIALTHGIIIQKKKNALIKTNILLAVIGLALVFYSTFLTRSGILSDFSVHSFSNAGSANYFVFFIIIILIVALFLLLKRFKDIKPVILQGHILSAENFIIYGIILILFYAFLILTGTSMPVLSRIFFSHAAALNERFYNIISMPFGLFILLSIIAAGILHSPRNRIIRFILFITLVSAVCTLVLNISSEVNTSGLTSYIFSFLGFFIILQNIFYFFNYKINKISAWRLTHIGLGILIIGIVTSNLHSYSIRKNLVKDIETDINSIKLVFKGINDFNLRSLKLLYNNNEIKIPYYFSEKMNFLYREPYIDHGFFKDIYISPIEYKNNSESYGRKVLLKGEEKTVDDINIKFIGFEIDKAHSSTDNVCLFTKLNVFIRGNNYTVKPGLIFTDGKERKNINAVIPCSNRKISLLDFNISKKEIAIYVEPSKKAINQPDNLIVEVSLKRLVWLVWAGTVLISIGGILAFKKKISL